MVNPDRHAVRPGVNPVTIGLMETLNAPSVLFLPVLFLGLLAMLVTVYHLVCAMRMTQLSIVIALGACAMIVAGILGPAPWLARESIFEFTAREPKNRGPAEPAAPPNDGPATPP